MEQKNINVRDYLRKKILSDEKHIISLEVCADCNNNCLNRYIQNKGICRNCSLKIENVVRKRYKAQKTTFEEDTSKISYLFGRRGAFRGGHRFILEIPPKSFRNLYRKKRRLDAYKEIVKFKTNNRNFKKIGRNKEILLYLAFHIKDYYKVTDCDNLAKSVCDVLQGIMYVKDSQIRILICEKVKVNSKINEGIVLSIKELTS